MRRSDRLELSNEEIVVRRPRIGWFLAIASVFLFVPFAEQGVPQASNPIIKESYGTQSLVSRNELLPPAKALKATERARIDLLHGRVEPARREIQRALNIAPHCAVALALQGLVHYQDKDYAEASQAFQRSIDEDPTLPVAYMGLATVHLVQGHFREALRPLDRADALLPGIWFTHFQSALAYLGLGESQSGLKEISIAERFIADDPEVASGLAYLRALANLQMKDYVAAKGFLQQAVKNSPNGPYAAFARRKLQQLNSVTNGIR